MTDLCGMIQHRNDGGRNTFKQKPMAVAPIVTKTSNSLVKKKKHIFNAKFFFIINHWILLGLNIE